MSGYYELPLPNVACSGIPVSAQLEEWTKLAGNDANTQRTLERLYDLFASATDLGSLISSANMPVRERMFVPDFAMVAPVLEAALAQERATDPVAAVFGNAVVGMARAATLLAWQYSLVVTNVPYLTRQKQTDSLRTYIDTRFPEAKANLATAFLKRCMELSAPEGTYAVVIPQNWLFQPAYPTTKDSVPSRTGVVGCC